MTTFDIWQLGEQYINGAAYEFSAAEQAEIRAFCIQMWYQEVVSSDVSVSFVDYQPYSSAKAMRDSVKATGHLLISREGNLEEGAAHPYTPELNLMHRAIHDWHHCQLGAGFNAPGEITASAHMVALARAAGYSMAVQQFLFCDMVGQLGYYYASGGNYSDDQKVVLFDPALIDELVRLYDELGASGLMAYLKPADDAARRQHNWRTQSAH